MRSAVIKPDAFAAAFDGIVQEIGEEAETKFFAAIDEAAEKCNEAVQEPLSRGHGVLTGEYRGHFAIDKETSQHRHVATWHVEEPEYRLTHLLENGHVTRDGTKRTKKIKHISKGREIAEKVLEERMKEIWG